jgi:hypothetical protein
MKKKKDACTISVGKPKGKRTPGRPGRRQEDNGKKDLQEIAWSCVDWIDLAQNRD